MITLARAGQSGGGEPHEEAGATAGAATGAAAAPLQ